VIARYTRPEMGAIWSDENKYRCWLTVEQAASDTLAKAGIVPKEAAKAIREKGNFSVARINEIEAEVRHDVIAFTTAVAEHIGPESRWLHYGLTSTDVVDTAQALQVLAASRIIRDGITRLTDVLRTRALEFKHTPMIGRTHGVHADNIWIEAAGLVLGDAAQSRTLRCGGRGDARRQALRRGRHLRPPEAGV